MTKCQNPNPSSQIWIVQDLTEIQGDDSEKKFSGVSQTPIGYRHVKVIWAALGTF